MQMDFYSYLPASYYVYKYYLYSRLHLCDLVQLYITDTAPIVTCSWRAISLRAATVNVLTMDWLLEV